ncbi:MAG: hypothetical protein ATN34_00525 [Epulopiscium sp. Nele67-Bin002]|nr:MAG: hypothetical protein ATN34_00525 [Epulopiscium sp. Nele67-Bin002]
MGDLLTNYLQQGVFLDKHDAIAILDTYNNIYHIVLDKKNYFAPLKSQAILDIFLEHEDTRMYINANSRLKYHLNGNIQDKITVSINKGNFKYLINFFYLHQHDIYLYCVDVLDDDCLYLDIVCQTSANLAETEKKCSTNFFTVTEHLYLMSHTLLLLYKCKKKDIMLKSMTFTQPRSANSQVCETVEQQGHILHRSDIQSGLLSTPPASI